VAYRQDGVCSDHHQQCIFRKDIRWTLNREKERVKQDGEQNCCVHPSRLARIPAPELRARV
jgi:hypothetical protein